MPRGPLISVVRRAADTAFPWLILAGLALVPVPDASGKSLLGLPSVCVWRSATGIACPGCGALRSLVCCAHGEWDRAMAFHPLGPVAFVGLLGWAGFTLPLPVRPRAPRTALWAIWRSRAGWLLGICATTVWLVRLLGFLPAAP